MLQRPFVDIATLLRDIRDSRQLIPGLGYKAVNGSERFEIGGISLHRRAGRKDVGACTGSHQASKKEPLLRRYDELFVDSKAVQPLAGRFAANWR